LFIIRNDHNIDFQDDCVVGLFVCALEIRYWLGVSTAEPFGVSAHFYQFVHSAG